MQLYTYKQFKLNMHTIYALYELAMTVQKWKMHHHKIPENFLINKPCFKV